jgi:serine/threonine protein kinase
MSAEPTTHPTATELAAFGLGKLTATAAAAVARHVERCDACRRAVENVPADSFVGLVRNARNPPTVSPADPGAPPRPSAESLPELPAELADHPRFRIVRELGRGGMGVVYQAEPRLMERPVAIKVINPSLLANPDALERFRREVKAAAQLAHPHIVAAYDAEQAGDLHLLVMEYIEGSSLAQVLERRGQLPLVHACHYARQAALGLQHAFERGMVHRDIKPQNLMLTPQGIIKILDFGLARLASERGRQGGLTQVDTVMGTPEYIAPEQATDARTADIRADIYSLGCTLYCLLAGRVPFHEDTPLKTILAHLDKEVPPLRELRPEVPAAVAAVVERMMAKDPARRYQKPVEVAQALLPFCKPGAKPSPATLTTLPRSAPSGRTGTVCPIHTSRMSVPPKEVTLTALAKEVEAGASALGEPDAGAIEPRRPGRRQAAAPLVRGRRWPVLAGVAAAVVALAVGGWLLAGGLFNELPPPKPGSAPAAANDLKRQGPIKLAAYQHGGNWRVVGDELIQGVATSDLAFLFFGDPSWTDYDVTVQAQRIKGDDLGWVVFRCEDFLNYWALGVWSQGQLRVLLTRIDGTPKPLQEKGWTLDDKWHTMRVKVRGEQIQCFMDDDQICDFPDARHPRGYVALATTKTATRFKNLKVTDASGRVLVDGVRDLDIMGQQSRAAGEDPVTEGSIWKGTWRVKGTNYEPDLLIRIGKREGTRFEGEFWVEKETKGLKIEGDIDAFGNISWRPTKVLAWDGWFTDVGDTLMTGTVKGKRMRAFVIYPQHENFMAEMVVTRHN